MKDLRANLQAVNPFCAERTALLLLAITKLVTIKCAG